MSLHSDSTNYSGIFAASVPVYMPVDYDCLCGLSWVHIAHSDGATSLCVPYYRTIRWKNLQQASQQGNALMGDFYMHFAKDCIHSPY